MFYILCAIGVILIVIGIYKENNKITGSVIQDAENDINSQEFNELKIRMTNIENILSYDFPEILKEEQIIDNIDISDGAISYESVAKVVNENISKMDFTPNEIDEDAIPSTLGIEKFNLLSQYEKEDYSIEEICTLLNMNKGEVLLLKSLYKYYQP
ncbi:hypothetical protein GC105_03285 [Alkalibaculum sp. M08DMB]|uniref:Uncharacterized protein n=1 Tax=Alkalibaculum sporogenes TaxID=2655001 RepID=A0A6A7K619_9FIRM|nr:hypothetical protein [Alkalibaculum sporogenes]MPW24814.1 hypothetical protein [Alkalibaculum sporogenes]